MLRVLGMQVIRLLVWSFDARHLLSPSGCSQLIGYGRFSEKYVLGHGTLLCCPGTNGVRSLLRQILLYSSTSLGRCSVMGPNSDVREPRELGVQGQMLDPARARPFGQCSVMGPDSVVREPQELGVCKGKCWVLLRHLLSVSTRSWDL
ncbi:hypothetical protein TIFTF001_021066, partial [Ficus carica]